MLAPEPARAEGDGHDQRSRSEDDRLAGKQIHIALPGIRQVEHEMDEEGERQAAAGGVLGYGERAASTWRG
jgi:hypothetical protein